eukprot:scaffold668510_cov38-Prasinocladus_malaysianus.AAC.1
MGFRWLWCSYELGETANKVLVMCRYESVNNDGQSRFLKVRFDTLLLEQEFVQKGRAIQKQKRGCCTIM